MKNAAIMDEVQKAIALVEKRFPGKVTRAQAIAFLLLSVRWLAMMTRDPGEVRKFVERCMALAMNERIVMPTPDEVAKLAGYEE